MESKLNNQNFLEQNAPKILSFMELDNETMKAMAKQSWNDWGKTKHNLKRAEEE